MAKENVTDDLRAELKTLADTLEEVLNSSADKSKEEMGKLRSKAESALKESRARLGETSEAILRQTRETAARADDYVRENPWTGVGIGAAVGLVLGVLLSRRLFWHCRMSPMACRQHNSRTARISPGTMFHYSDGSVLPEAAAKCQICQEM